MNEQSSDRHGGQAAIPGGEHTATLAAGWRAAAERGVPALVLVPAVAGGAGAGGAGGADSLVVRWANRPVLELIGAERSELVGRALGDLPSDGPTALAAVLRRRLNGSDDEPVAFLRRGDETRQAVGVDVDALPPPTVGWLVRLSPMSEDERALQTALREAEHRFHTLAEHAPTGIFVSEAGARLGYVNARFAEIFGRDPARLLGTRWLERVAPEDLGGLQDGLEEALKGEPVELSVRLAPGQGPLQWVHLRLAPTTTPSRAAGFIGTAEDVTARRIDDERVSYQASHDPLTGLANRRRLSDVLAQHLDGRRGSDVNFAVLLFDLDGFKDVNDRFGHEAGDRLLVEVAQRLRRASRDSDLLARLAGDEFVAVLHGVRSVAGAETAVRRHLDAMATPFTLGAAQTQVSASIGLALPVPGDTPASLLRRADRAMYQAKSAGTGGYRVAAAAGGHS